MANQPSFQQLEASLLTQGLVVLYSSIDTMAWVNLPSGDVTRPAFKKT